MLVENLKDVPAGRHYAILETGLVAGFCYHAFTDQGEYYQALKEHVARRGTDNVQGFIVYNRANVVVDVQI